MLGIEMTPDLMLILGVLGVVMLVVGLIKKIKFIVKLGVVIALVGFIANGGLTMLASYF